MLSARRGTIYSSVTKSLVCIIKITGSILTSGGDNMYLNVKYFDSAFSASSGGVDTGCPRGVKRIAVTNDFGKSLLDPWLCIEKALSRSKRSNCSRLVVVSIKELVCRLRTTFKITCCCFVVVLLGRMYKTTLAVFD